MRLFWLRTPFTLIASVRKFDAIRSGKIVKHVKPEICRLSSHLLEMGGEKVVVWLNENPGLYDALIRAGHFCKYKKLYIRKGEERACHSNSATLWLRNKKKYKLVTGFGLSDDKIWRRHSWIITDVGNLIETTLPREIYFGLSLDKKIAEKFAEIYIE